MCTSMALTDNDLYFGRTLDWTELYNDKVVICPANYPFRFKKEGECRSHYAMIGMAMTANNYPLYAEAVNEKGLCIAGLHFPSNAHYMKAAKSGNYNVSAFELIPWLLSKFADCDEAYDALSRTTIVDIPFNDDLPLTPLHWHIADKKRSLTAEAVGSGLMVYNNPVGVLANNPPFDFHMHNLSNYLNLKNTQPENNSVFGSHIRPYGNGMGSIGLPGDFSSSSRFVRCAYLKQNSAKCATENERISQFFHILDSVSLPKGSVITANGGVDFTHYSCCVNADKGIYYYKSYNNNQICAVDMRKENLDGSELIIYPMEREQSISFIN